MIYIIYRIINKSKMIKSTIPNYILRSKPPITFYWSKLNLFSHNISRYYAGLPISKKYIRS